MVSCKTRCKRIADGTYFVLPKSRWNNEHDLSDTGCYAMIAFTVLILYALGTVIAGPILMADSMNGVWKSECVLVKCETPRQGVYFAVDFNMTETINGRECETQSLGKSVVCYAGPGKGITLFHRKGFALSLGLLIPAVVILVFFSVWGSYWLYQVCAINVRIIDDTLAPPKPVVTKASSETDPIAKHTDTGYQSLDDSSSSSV